MVRRRTMEMNLKTFSLTLTSSKLKFRLTKIPSLLLVEQTGLREVT